MLNGENFDKVMWDRTKSKLVLFYADWSDYSKDFMPAFERLCDSGAGMKDLVVAKFDTPNNDYPTNVFKLQGYPAIFFVTRDGKVSSFPISVKLLTRFHSIANNLQWREKPTSYLVLDHSIDERAEGTERRTLSITCNKGTTFSTLFSSI